MAIICDWCGKIVLERRAFCKASCKVMYYRKQGLHKGIKPQIRLEVWKRDGFKCLNCGTNEKLQIDHISPQINGVNNDISNLQTLCATCNISKGTKTINFIKSFPERKSEDLPERLKEVIAKKEITFCKHNAALGLCKYGC